MQALHRQFASTLISEVFASGIDGFLLRVMKARCAIGIVPFVGPLPIGAAGYHPILWFTHVLCGLNERRALSS